MKAKSVSLILVAVVLALVPLTQSAEAAKNDFNGDNISDLGVFWRNFASWYVTRTNGSVLANGTNWGFAGCITVAGDYSGDRIDDMALFYPAAGTWYIRTLSNTLLAFGANWGFSGCTPVPGDYNNDKTNDLAVFHTATGNWYIRTLKGAVLAFGANWGFNGCTAAPGDYNGDGVADLAVFYPPTGNWYIRNLSGPALALGANWGFNGCIPAPGDYNGDRIEDLAVFYPPTGSWYIRTLGGTVLALGTNWGFSGCMPVPGDYNGDGRDDLAVYHAGTAKWYIRTLAGQTLAFGSTWGAPAATALGGFGPTTELPSWFVSTYRTPQLLLNWMKSNIRYGWPGYPNQNTWSYLPPTYVYSAHQGDCTAQAAFEADVLRQNGYACGLLWVSRPQGSHHGVCYWPGTGGYYYLEHAFEMFKGIYGPFATVRQIGAHIYTHMVQHDHLNVGYTLQTYDHIPYGVNANGFWPNLKPLP
jgi:hypothetical protein